MTPQIVDIKAVAKSPTIEALASSSKRKSSEQRQKSENEAQIICIIRGFLHGNCVTHLSPPDHKCVGRNNRRYSERLCQFSNTISGNRKIAMVPGHEGNKQRYPFVEGPLSAVENLGVHSVLQVRDAPVDAKYLLPYVQLRCLKVMVIFIGDKKYSDANAAQRCGDFPRMAAGLSNPWR